MPPDSSNQATRKKARVMSTDDLVSWAREKIRTGQFAPGQRLIESDIIRETGVSRNKVREALQRLATEGLLTIEAFRGASVKSITWDEVRQIYKARMALEGFAAAEFAASDNSELKQKLKQAQQEMNKWVKQGDHERFAELNSEWHELIIDGSMNEYFRQFLSRLTIPIYRLLFTIFYSKNRIAVANADHKKITAAILAGNPAESERLMRAHIEEGLKALSEINSRLS
jgi:DNA-binding GntR family transcriptional regulator